MSGDPGALRRTRPRPDSTFAIERLASRIAFCALVLFAALLLRSPLQQPLAWFRDVVLYNVVCGAAAIGAAARARHTSLSTVRRAWAFMCAAMLITLVANVYYSLVVAPSPDQPDLSLADIGYWVFYPLVYVFVIALLRSRMTHWQPSFAIDGVAGALLATAVSLAFVVRPLMEGPHSSLTPLLIRLTWPIGDTILIVILLFGPLVVATGLDRQMALVTAGLAIFAVGDSVYVVLASRGDYAEGGVLDLT